MHRKPNPRAGHSAEHLVLGRAIREIRARRSYSQEEFGLHAGLHRNYVGALERGEINATFKTLLAVATGLGVSLSELVTLYERRRDEPIGTAHD
jgi:transcriptional regulator with XRE-family HTH domain